MKGQGSKGVVAVCMIIIAIALILFGRSISFLFPSDIIPLINYLSLFLIVLSVLILW